MKFSFLLVAAFAFVSSLACASDGVEIQTGGCTVMSYNAKDGSNFKTLAFQKLDTSGTSSIVLFNDGTREYTLKTWPNTYNGTPTTELLLVIQDVKTGEWIADSSNQWTTGAEMPTIMSVGTQSNQVSYAIQCMR